MSQQRTEERHPQRSGGLWKRRIGLRAVSSLTIGLSATALILPTSSAFAARAVIDSQAPMPATNLHSTGTTASTVTLAWSPASDNVAVTRYELWRGDPNWSAWTLAASLPANSLSFLDAGLTSSTSYTYGLRAFDLAGNKSASSNIPLIETSAASAPATDTVAPTAAQRVRATGTNSTSVSLAWDPASDNVAVHHYEIWRGDANWSNWSLAGAVPASTLIYTDTGLLADTTYTYGIRTFDAAGNTSPSSSILAIATSGSTATPTPTPTATPKPTPTPTPTPTPRPTASPPPTAGTSSRYYADNSPVNSMIRANPVIDPNNAAWVAHAQQTHWYINTIDYATAIVYATGNETRYAIHTAHDGDWGPAFAAGGTIPIQPSWKPAPGSDAWLVVVDTDGTAYWLWQYSWNGGHPTASWGGSGKIDHGQINPLAATGSGNGSGMTPVTGTITAADLQRGVIDHALAFADPWTASTFKFPAIKSDGHDSGNSPMPEGQRVQLDPSINVGTQSWTPMEKMIARALQTYGAYLVDSSGGSFGLAGEMDQAAVSGGSAGPMWGAYGINGDYASLSDIPMGSLRFLANANGS